MRSAIKLSTYADLFALGEEARAEILAGQISTAPSPLPEHSRVQGALGDAVGAPFDRNGDRGGPGGWWILQEVDVRFTRHDIVRPDLSGWRRERLPSPWGVRPIDVVPDWVCEILSPTNAAHDRVHKANLYATHAVAYYWIVDPAERTLEAFRLDAGHWIMLGSYDSNSSARIAPFEAVQIEVGRLFPPRG